MKQNEKRNTGSEGSEEIKEGSNLRETGYFSTIQERFGKSLTEEQRFSADGQNTALNYTTMRVVVTMQFWAAVSPQKKIYNQSFMRKLRSQ